MEPELQSPQIDLQLKIGPENAESQVKLLDQTAFWNVEGGEPEQNQPSFGLSLASTQAPPPDFSSVPVPLNVQTKARGKGPVLAAGALAAILGWFGYCFVSHGEMPGAAIARVFGHGGSMRPTVSRNIPEHNLAQLPMPASKELPRTRKIIPTPGLTSPHPFDGLLNSMASPSGPRLPSISADLQEEYGAALAGENYYARYKTVLDIIEARREGSDVLLREAINSGKFWMRMNAVIGLADLGYKVSDEDLKAALGDAHSELRARFFEKLTTEGRCKPGCMFVARGMMKMLDSGGRLSSLALIAREESPVSASYVIAGLFDADPRIQEFSKKWQLEQSIEDSLWWSTFNQIFNPDKAGSTRPAGEKSAVNSQVGSETTAPDGTPFHS